jgi:hypothetical protein
MDLQHCPTCGSELECGEGLTYAYCVSSECGAVFRDVELRGLARRRRLDGSGRHSRSRDPACPAMRADPSAAAGSGEPRDG